MGSRKLAGIASAPQPVSVLFTLDSVLPNISQALNNTGFIFGAGASYEAGYPMMQSLTKNVIGALDSTERDTLDQVLDAANIVYDDNKGTPNIEDLADVVIAHHTNTNQPIYRNLENRFRQLILEMLLSIEKPSLDNHVKFFEKLKARAYGQPCTVWIWTTNYDLLLETAASLAGVQLENGFTGTTERYFTPEIFQRVSGVQVGNRFTPNNQLVVKLIKLHGSISWFKDAGKIYERHPDALSPDAERVMVMPRRRKILDTLVCPYDSLFSISTRILGNQCKYLTSCGFSFADDHINQNLVFPVINGAKCYMSVLSDCEPTNLSSIMSLPNYTGGYQSLLRIKGQEATGTTDLWQFSKFIELF